MMAGIMSVKMPLIKAPLFCIGTGLIEKGSCFRFT